MLHPSPTYNCPQDNSEGTYLGPVFENASIMQTCLCTPSGNGTQSCHPTPTLQSIPKNHSCAQPLHALNSAINKLKKCNKIQYFLQLHLNATYGLKSLLGFVLSFLFGFSTVYVKMTCSGNFPCCVMSFTGRYEN